MTTRCAYCRHPITARPVVCRFCGSAIHELCLRRVGACAQVGCAVEPTPDPEKPPRAPARRGVRRTFTLYALLSAAIGIAAQTHVLPDELARLLYYQGAGAVWTAAMGIALARHGLAARRAPAVWLVAGLAASALYYGVVMMTAELSRDAIHHQLRPVLTWQYGVGGMAGAAGIVVLLALVTRTIVFELAAEALLIGAATCLAGLDGLWVLFLFPWWQGMMGLLVGRWMLEADERGR